MRIERIDRIGVDRYLYIQIHTDAGISGLGVEPRSGIQERYPFTPRTIETALHEDGSVADR